MTARAEARRLGKIVADLMASAMNPESAQAPGSREVQSVSACLLRSGAAPLAWWAIRSSPCAGEAHSLLDAYRKEALRSAIADHELAQLFRSFRAEGLDPVLGKGWAVARHYPEASLRPFCDFDVYVERGAHGTLEGVLSSRGSEHSFEVDLHEWSYLDDRSAAEIRSRTKQEALRDTTVRVFGLEDQLRLACLHACAEGLIRPAWLCDVAVLVKRAGQDFDWDYFATGSARRTEWCFATIQLARDLLCVDTSRVPGSASWKPLPRWFARSVLEAWGSDIRPRGSRAPFAEAKGARAILAALRARWPLPIEATIGAGGSISSLPRLPYKIADGVLRMRRFLGRR